jgi:cyclophilin family peptidyl-prolyl cis-trans isomerase
MKWMLAVCVGLLATVSWGGTLAQFRTVFGTIEVELFDAERPVTVQNFKRLVESGAYRDTFLHRLVPGFIAQGGGFKSLSPTSTNLFAPLWTSLAFTPNFGPITNEFNVGPFISNTNRTLAMAKQAISPDSATSQWFFNLTNNAAILDGQNGGFTVFGRVVRDTNNVLAFLNARSYGDGIVSMGWWYPNDFAATNYFTQLPVPYSGFFHPTYASLIYVDVTLLSVQVQLSNGVPAISWNSVAGRTNLVEYTAQFPPQWQTLAQTNGTGSRLMVLDGTAGTNRFYRVRVIY